jgi:GNAT superfamily N-acetyltransferase
MLLASIADHMHLVPTIAKWHWDEWGDADPDGSLHSWKQGLAQHANQDRIPTTYVALQEGQPLGSVTLVEHDMSIHLDLTPWLAGVYVTPEHRGRGVGTALVSHAMREAAKMGVCRLYLYTESARDFYRKLGWEEIDTDFYEGKPVSIMAIDLRKGET